MYQLTQSPNFEISNDISDFEKIVLGVFLYKCASEKLEVLECGKFQDWIDMGVAFNMTNFSDGIHSLLRLNPELETHRPDDLLDFLSKNFYTIMGTTSGLATKNMLNVIYRVNEIDVKTNLNDVLGLFYKKK